MIRLVTRIHRRDWLNGRNVMARCFEIWSMGSSIRIIIENTNASTPPSLLGIDRRIAYANRKYHSGLMWGGVFNGLAGV